MDTVVHSDGVKFIFEDGVFRSEGDTVLEMTKQDRRPVGVIGDDQRAEPIPWNAEILLTVGRRGFRSRNLTMGS